MKQAALPSGLTVLFLGECRRGYSVSLQSNLTTSSVCSKKDKVAVLLASELALVLDQET